MTWYPLTCDCQCPRCGGHTDPGHVDIRDIGLGRMNGGRTWACPGMKAHKQDDAEYQREVSRR